jgi:hypothetical protein
VKKNLNDLFEKEDVGGDIKFWVENILVKKNLSIYNYFGLFSGVGSKVPGREGSERRGRQRAGGSHALPPIVRASWEARLQASYSHQMGGKEEASREERERSKGPRPETPRMMNEDFCF